jgi:hypothetical protein
MKPKLIHHLLFAMLIMTLVLLGCADQRNPEPTPTATATPPCSEFENPTEIQTLEDLILGKYEVWDQANNGGLSHVGNLCILQGEIFFYENISEPDYQPSRVMAGFYKFSSSGHYVIKLGDDLTLESRIEEISINNFYLGSIYIEEIPGLFIIYEPDTQKIGFYPMWSVLFFPQIFKTIPNW